MALSSSGRVELTEPVELGVEFVKGIVVENAGCWSLLTSDQALYSFLVESPRSKLTATKHELCVGEDPKQAGIF